MFRTFLRTWWIENPAWPNSLEPCAGERDYQEDYDNEKDARQACQDYNRTHEAGRLSLKMEYEGED